eukprot:CAMPEP_0170752384 /NCGR_PEP_ID=MMETSP0437-20130122/11941_1 /TAXON_ID=0 /ORGANISM="Sexangularia sp." /LENGTH=543 /DNA_ID=CAMNT_0011091453 /DNA_START=189 /DNA_END=1821 /DNA_ORIENTATION=+
MTRRAQQTRYYYTATPVLAAFSGGPGAASLLAANFDELGPLRISQLATNPVANPHSFLQTPAHLIFIDSPGPVGFSYCTSRGPVGDARACGSWNDTTTAVAAATALLQAPDVIATALASRTSNNATVPVAATTGPWAIWAESYGGVYAPTLLAELAARGVTAAAGTAASWRRYRVGARDGVASSSRWSARDGRLLATSSTPPYIGYMVGDGCMGTKVLCGGAGEVPGPYLSLRWFMGQGVISLATQDAISDTCTTAELKSGQLSAACGELVGQPDGKAWQEIGSYYVYNLFDFCTTERPFALADGVRPRITTSVAGGPPTSTTIAGGAPASGLPPGAGKKRVAAASAVAAGGWTPLPNISVSSLGFGCMGRNAADYIASPAFRTAIGVPRAQRGDYIASPAFRTAIGVPVNASFFTGDNGVGFVYHPSYPDVRTAAEQLINKGFRILIYNGDSDPAINSVTTQYLWSTWADDRYGAPSTGWTPYSLNGGSNVVGAYMQWADGRLTWASLRGSGHLAPLYQPQTTLAAVRSWLRTGTLPPYVAQ